MTNYAKIALEMGKGITRDIGAVGTLGAAALTPLVPRKAVERSLEELHASKNYDDAIGYLSGGIEAVAGGTYALVNCIDKATSGEPLAAIGTGVLGLIVAADGANRIYRASEGKGYKPTNLSGPASKAAKAVKGYLERRYDEAVEKVDEDHRESHMDRVD